MSGNMLGHDAECDCGPCDNERMQKYLTRNSPCNFCLPTRKQQAAKIGELQNIIDNYPANFELQQRTIEKLERDNEAKQALIDNFKLDDLMAVFTKELEKQIVLTFEASRAKALSDAIEAVDAAGGDNEDYHIEAIKRKFGSEI